MEGRSEACPQAMRRIQLEAHLFVLGYPNHEGILPGGHQQHPEYWRSGQSVGPGGHRGDHQQRESHDQGVRDVRVAGKQPQDVCLPGEGEPAHRLNVFACGDQTAHQVSAVPVHHQLLLARLVRQMAH